MRFNFLFPRRPAPPTPTRGIPITGRPGTLAELLVARDVLGWDKAYDAFLEEFWAHPCPSALVDPPGALAGVERCVVAATVASLAEWFDWPIPEWAQGDDCVMESVTLVLPQRLREGLTQEETLVVTRVLCADGPPRFLERNLAVRWGTYAPR